jgi:menaquinone-9 beta-reductase
VISDSADWDAIVVGAGVAGGSMALILVSAGWRVLLVEKSAWPREKVCGCCLSAAAISALAQIGAESAIQSAAPLDHVVWHFKQKSLALSLPGGAAILRSKLDAAIVSQAVSAGGQFLPGCCATLLPARSSDPFRTLELRTENQTSKVRARVVIACDGIGGTLLATEPWAQWTISRRSWIGVAATYPSGVLPPGQIHMLVAKHGYVGQISINDSTDHMAAALDPAACRRFGGPAKLIAQILRSCGRDLPESLQSSRLHGAGFLTRRRRTLGGHRVLAIGDACGYVEPFTGEGMAWATLGAIEIARLLPGPRADWPTDLPQRWRRQYLQIIGHRQRWCRAMRPTMHHPVMAGAAIKIASRFPHLAQSITSAVCRPGALIRSKENRDDNPGHFHVAPASSGNHARHPGHRHRQPAPRPAGIDA